MDWSELLRDSWQTSLVFVSLLIFTRILGKTQVGQLTFYEYINGITIGSIAATIVGSEADKVWSHYYDLILFIALTYLISLVTLKSRPFRKILEGTPTIVINNGQILKENMHSMRYDVDELTSQLRQQGVLDISEVQFAILETSGELSVIKNTANQQLTKSDLSLQQPDSSLPVELIIDGQTIEGNLKSLDKSQAWLDNQLLAQGVDSVSQVTYAVIDSKGKLFISRKTSEKMRMP